MIFLRYARNRLRAFLEQIQRLLDSEFPYPQSSEAIADLEQSFKAELHLLDSFSEHSDVETVKQECVLALSLCFENLPVLGFLLRSTNVRNAFEAFWPLFRLAREALEPAVPEKDRRTRLVLSSEWDYSPLTYPSIQHLPSFVLIGLPAPESENPLLLPLAGHELGHSLWLKKDLKNAFLAPIKTAIIDSIKKNWGSYRQVFSEVSDDQNALTSDQRALESWAPAVPWALHQAQETFCDFVAIRLFGRAYLSAFAYLLSPNNEGQRSEFYPSMITRVANMVSAATEFNVDHPSEYEELFQDDSEPYLVPADTFRLSRADDALACIVHDLALKAGEMIADTSIVLPTRKEVRRIANHLRKVRPAERTKSLADILNAAWLLSEDDKLWLNSPQLSSKRDRILRELVLKNVEVFEIEQRLGA